MPPENLENKQTTTFQVSRTTLRKSGLLQIPAAGPVGTPDIFVRIHAPSEQEVVTFCATSECGPPVVPSPYAVGNAAGLNSNLVLLDWNIGGIIPQELGASVGHKWSISGVYYYGKENAEGLTNMRLGKLPWEADANQKENYFPVENFSTAILDPTTEYESPSLDTAIEAPKGG